MDSLQQNLFRLMKKFDGFCQEHGIEYYLGGGSALGCIRHKGFLPWDDDVDLYITRKHYKKLLSVAKELEELDCVLVDTTFFSNYSNTLVRIVELDNTMIFQHRMMDGTPKGYFIELFILDPIPREEKARELWLKKHWVYTELHSIMFISANQKVAEFVDRELIDDYMIRYEKNSEKVVGELENELFSIDEKDSDEYRLRWGINNNIYRIEWFGSPRYVPFADYKLPVPQNVMSVLRADYGDYWMIIPEHEDQILHSDMVMNEDVAYTKYTKDYSQFIDLPKALAAYLPRKKALLNRYFVNLESLHRSQELHEAILNSKIKYQDISAAKLKKYAEEKNFDKIMQEMEVWYNLQFSDLYAMNKRSLKIDDDLLYYTLLPLLISGEFSKVRRGLLLKERDSKNTGKLKAMQDFVEAIRNAYIFIDLEKFGEIEKCLLDAEKFEYAKEQFDYRFLLLFMQGKKESNKESLQKLLDQTQEYIECYPDKEAFLYVKGMIQQKLGNQQGAIESFRACKNRTRNGMLLMELEDIC